MTTVVSAQAAGVGRVQIVDPTTGVTGRGGLQDARIIVPEQCHLNGATARSALEPSRFNFGEEDQNNRLEKKIKTIAPEQEPLMNVRGWKLGL
ncbi:hypothetical protein [Brevundimonas sp.]|uniref:hypothetical protein n=1 Tax=Brevundimonas sp. TaxID=1871086 RepID=UPI0024870E36|nr:hypothetical protein [Brevundimonas sp.]MDI1281750.1 hypothetical protein [Brevundimonas sp.]